MLECRQKYFIKLNVTYMNFKRQNRRENIKSINRFYVFNEIKNPRKEFKN